MIWHKKWKGESDRDVVHSGKLDSIMRDKNVPLILKRKAFNECILPVMTYSCETWSLSNTQLEKLHGHNPKEGGEHHGRSHTEGQKEYKLDPETEWCDRHYHKHKANIDGRAHVARRHDNRWTIRVTEWIPRGHKRPRGWQRTKWCNDLIGYVGPTWSHVAKDRMLWKACREEGCLLRERETTWLRMVMMMLGPILLIHSLLHVSYVACYVTLRMSVRPYLCISGTFAQSENDYQIMQ